MLVSARWAQLVPGQAEFASGFGFEVFLGMLALALASFASGGRATRLGLQAGRIPGGAVFVLASGTLALSFALDGIYTLSGAAEHGALEDFEAILGGARGWTIVAALMSFAAAPGIAEEMLCRGWLQRGLAERFSPATAVVLASLVFGALHIEPVYAVLTAVLGLYLGVIAQVARSIRPAIVCHAFNNAVAVVSTAFSWDLDANWPAVGVSAVIAAAALAAVCFRLADTGSGVSDGPSESLEIRPVGPKSGSDSDGIAGVGLQPERHSDDP
jgi:hypothetical protein